MCKETSRRVLITDDAADCLIKKSVDTNTKNLAVDKGLANKIDVN
jgi:hypothetical protein